MNYQKRHREKQAMASRLMKELEEYERLGAQLYIGDEPCSPQEIARACVFSEDTEYMRDFVMDDSRNVAEIHFVKLGGK